MILQSWARAFRQIRDPAFRRVTLLGAALAVALLFALYALLLLTANLFTRGPVTLPMAGEVQGLGTLLSPSSILFLLVLSVFLMVPVASVFTGLFLDDVVDAVEAADYDHLAPAPRAGLWVTLTDTLRYIGVLLGVNLVGMAVFAASGGLGIVIFWALNGFLLAREYFNLVAMRRLSPESLVMLRGRWWWRSWGAGVVLAVLLTVPILNLFVPVLGVMAFTHLFHAMIAREAQRP